MNVRLLESTDDMKHVIMESAQFLLTPDKSKYSYSADTSSVFEAVRAPGHGIIWAINARRLLLMCFWLAVSKVAVTRKQMTLCWYERY